MKDLTYSMQKDWNRLSELWKELSINWKDEQRHIFEKKYWQPLTMESKGVIQASAHLVSVMESAKRNVR